MWTYTSHSESGRPASSTSTLVPRVGAEAVRQDAAGRAAADDHDVVGAARTHAAAPERPPQARLRRQVTSSLSSRSEPLLPPRLGVLDVVEREDVEAGHLPALEDGTEAVDERVGAEPARQEASREAAVLPQEAERVADPDPCRDAERASRDSRRRGRRRRSGAVCPRAQTFSIHCAVTPESKQTWLVMYVACRAFSNIAAIVVSSSMNGWLSG